MTMLTRVLAPTHAGRRRRRWLLRAAVATVVFLVVGSFTGLLLLAANVGGGAGDSADGAATPGGDLVQFALTTATANHLPDTYFAAQMAAESDFNPYETSPAGAQGVAQIMPGEWRHYAVDGDGDGRTDVWNPWDSIATGAKIDAAYRAQVTDIGPNLDDLMAAAYNAGVGAVRSHHGVPPYPETQHYLAHIHQLIPTIATRRVPWPPAAATGAGTSQAVKIALAQVGKPYVWGATGPDAFDCSGLILYAYAQVGVDFPRYTAADMQRLWPHIPAAQAQPGDIVWSYPKADGTAGHVGMVIGGGLGVFAPQPGETVRVERITPILSSLGYGRVPAGGNR